MSDKAMMYGEGVFASRPSAATAGDGHVYFATDTGNLYRSNGTTWTQIATLSGTPSSAIGSSELIYRYTVAGSDKASIDTGADTAQAGSTDWTNGDILEIWILAQGDNAATLDVGIDVFLNNDTGSNYDNQALTAVNTTVAGAGQVGVAGWPFNTHGQGGNTNYPSVHRITIPAFTLTTFYKVGESSTSRTDATAANERMDFRAVAWRNTAAITRVKVAARTTQKLKVGSQLAIYKRLAS